MSTEVSFGSEFRNVLASTKDFNMTQEALPDVMYSTGILNVDFLNGQKALTYDKDGNCIEIINRGILDGSIIMVIGRSGCGKSTFVSQAALEIIRPFPKSIILEDCIEGGMVERRLQLLSGWDAPEIKRRMIRRNCGITAENFYKRIKLLHDLKLDKFEEYKYDTGMRDFDGNPIYKLQPTVYIVDSLPLLLPEKLLQEEEMSGQMAATATAKLLAAIFRRITPICKSANIIVFFINHITKDVDISGRPKKTKNIFLKQGETTPGGETPMYLCTNIFRMDDHDKLTEEDKIGIQGNMVTFSLTKSRTNCGGSSTEIVFTQELGFDPTLSLYVALKDAGYVGGAGAWWYLKSLPEVKFSQKGFRAKLFESPELQERFLKDSYEAMSTLLKKNLEANVIMRDQMLTIMNNFNTVNQI